MGKYAFGTPRLNCPHWYVMQWDLTEFDGPVFKGVDLITDGLLGPQIGDCDGWGEWAPRLSDCADCLQGRVSVNILAKTAEGFVNPLPDLTCCELLTTTIKRVDRLPQHSSGTATPLQRCGILAAEGRNLLPSVLHAFRPFRWVRPDNSPIAAGVAGRPTAR
jgi:hypothetical protein